MKNLFERIQQYPKVVKERKEKVVNMKEEIMTYLLKSQDANLRSGVWFEFNDIIADGKLIDDKEMEGALKEGYLRTLKEYVGELPIIESKSDGETSHKGDFGEDLSFLRTKKILDIVTAIDAQKWERVKKKNPKAIKGGPFRARDAFIESFKDNPEFFRLTKEALILSLNQANVLEDHVHGAYAFMPALVPDEVKRFPEVQQAGKNVLMRALQNDTLLLAQDFKEDLELSEKVLQSPDVQQAIQNAIDKQEEKLKKIKEETEKDPMLWLGIDQDEIWQREKLLVKMKTWGNPEEQRPPLLNEA